MKLNTGLLIMAALVAAPGAARADAKSDAATKAVTEAAAFHKDNPGPATAQSAHGYNSGAFDSVIEIGQACLKAAGGMGSAKLTIDGVEISFADAKASICQPVIDFGIASNAFIEEEQKAKRAEKSQKYIDAGIQGERLELFIEYDDVNWRGKKCEIVDDVAVLKTAKKLFQWLENADGTHTIRTYTFKGDKVKSVKDKRYKTEAKAYKGCK